MEVPLQSKCRKRSGGWLKRQGLCCGGPSRSRWEKLGISYTNLYRRQVGDSNRRYLSKGHKPAEEISPDENKGRVPGEQCSVEFEQLENLSELYVLKEILSPHSCRQDFFPDKVGLDFEKVRGGRC